MATTSKYSVSASGIDEYIWDMRKAAWRMVGDSSTADNAIEPIVWYIRTGRASSNFLRAMLQHRPSTIAKRCLGCASYDDAIDRVKGYLLVE